MKFSVLVAILAEEMEDKAIDIARESGAGAATILNARGLTADSKKTFFGLTYEGAQSVVMFVLEKKLSVRVLKCLTKELDLDNDDRGIAFTIPLEHLGGIDTREVEQFTQKLEDEL
ncbi:transcriptional regulator [Wenzhouxiangella sp. AB-CW3]|uniref:transcriptional regulator n=1 Tax=Wenzhouxiangella sp. AB-CW3 TaxID=2771012 RepID=UPI00168B2E49|nr:transcriptional regulator [Wenzhouxiangella sp. AB-CW3]QOC22982.1 transcriptional regulator [Wenzhouxiangella sp. AB-CW3]